MKRGTPEHPKMIDLAEAVLGHLEQAGIALPFDLCQNIACGIMERLWHFTARYANDGDIGDIAPRRVAQGVGWPYDAQLLIEILKKTRWLDVNEKKPLQLLIHDWPQHSDEGADRWLADNNLKYANGMRPRNKPRQNSRGKRGTNATPTRQRQDAPRLSESESESGSYSESKSDVDSPNGESIPSKSPKGTYPKSFEAFWALYPLKVGKEAALRAWTRAGERLRKSGFSSQEAVGRMFLAVEEFARSPVGRGDFCPHPSVWLNQGRYDDDRSAWQKSGEHHARKSQGPNANNGSTGSDHARERAL